MRHLEGSEDPAAMLLSNPPIVQRKCNFRRQIVLFPANLRCRLQQGAFQGEQRRLAA